VVSVLLLFLAVRLTQAQGGEPSAPLGVTAPQAIVGTSFTYQGRLVKSGTPVSDTCDFQFGLWDAASGGNQVGVTQTVASVAVVDGYFTAQLNSGDEFTTSPFTGTARYLAIEVKCSGDGSYTPMSERIALRPAPYALALPGLWTQDDGSGTPNIIGGYSGNQVGDLATGATIGGGGREGMGHINYVGSSYGTIGGGFGNTITGSHATIGGGGLNNASGEGAVVGGGGGIFIYDVIWEELPNAASGNWSTVGGGGRNTASGTGAVVAGGGGVYISETLMGPEWIVLPNTASGNWSTVGGGGANVASGYGAVVAGGGAYDPSSGYAVTNTASGDWSTVGGGTSNTADDEYATVCGGGNNTASGIAAVVAGGGGKSGAIVISNTASGDWSVVGGGGFNTASASYAIVDGGNYNAATKNFATIGGGLYNAADAEYATIGGGSNHWVTATHGTVCGGDNITVTGLYAAVGGGQDNAASGGWTTIGGGSGNEVGGLFGTVGGGGGNAARGPGSTIGGGGANVVTAAWGTIGGGWLITATGDAATVGGGMLNTASGDYATVPGGAMAEASHYGQVAHASGGFSTIGDAQESFYVLRGTTSPGSAAAELFLDGSSQRLAVVERTMTFDILVSARTSVPWSAGYTARGVIEGWGGSSVGFVGTPITTTLGDDITAIYSEYTSFNVYAESGSLVIKVTGPTATTTRWVATVRTSEVGY
jgi:hypothetical protein